MERMSTVKFSAGPWNLTGLEKSIRERVAFESPDSLENFPSVCGNAAVVRAGTSSPVLLVVGTAI